MRARTRQESYLIGIDEVGRGPLAGPVSVGAVIVPTEFDWSIIPGVGDSKQVSPLKRVAVFEQARQLKRAGKLDYEVVSISAKRIDRIGIAPAIKEALTRALTAVVGRQKQASPEVCVIKLDGGLRAPAIFPLQETIIKGDAKEPVIGLASIIAKVTRDTYMERLGRKVEFVPYDFATHKGYGTKQHRAVIAATGLSRHHRASFCRNIRLKT